MHQKIAMPLTKKTTADAFFALQLVLALISGGSEFRRLLSTTQGIDLSWLASWLAFLLINLALTIRAHRRQPSRVTLQAVLTYAAWSTVIAACLGAMLWNATELWDAKDTLTAMTVALGLAITGLAAWRLGLGLGDPLVHAGFAACCIGLPQLILSYKIFTVGGAGMAGLMLLAGHIGICTRLGQLWFAIREAGWDRNRQGAALRNWPTKAPGSWSPWPGW